MPKARVRLDALLVERGLVDSREKGRRLIMAGEVLVKGQIVDKPGTPVDGEAAVELKARPRFVSRGGDKLAGALADFGLSPAGLVCADVGASTGGFTDCLLQAGAQKVYALDVGEGILDWKLRTDPRVVVMENTNARFVERLPEVIQLAVIDASFISLRLLLPVVAGWLGPAGRIVSLIKPQFEAGRERVGRKGVVRDPEVHREVVNDILEFASRLTLTPRALTRSRLLGPAGNVEFLVWLEAGGPAGPERETLLTMAGLRPAERPEHG